MEQLPLSCLLTLLLYIAVIPPASTVIKSSNLIGYLSGPARTPSHHTNTQVHTHTHTDTHSVLVTVATALREWGMSMEAWAAREWNRKQQSREHEPVPLWFHPLTAGDLQKNENKKALQAVTQPQQQNKKKWMTSGDHTGVGIPEERECECCIRGGGKNVNASLCVWG